jgi:hypothetical protein
MRRLEIELTHKVVWKAFAALPFGTLWPIRWNRERERETCTQQHTSHCKQKSEICAVLSPARNVSFNERETERERESVGEFLSREWIIHVIRPTRQPRTKRDSSSSSKGPRAAGVSDSSSSQGPFDVYRDERQWRESKVGKNRQTKRMKRCARSIASNLDSRLSCVCVSDV